MKLNNSGQLPSQRRDFFWTLGVLVVLLLVLFHKSFFPGYVLFGNDGPLGAQMADAIRLPGAFTGVWSDLNSIGSGGGVYPPNVYVSLFWLLGPLAFSKYLVPIQLLIFGVGAWTFFRQLKLTSAACLLGAAGMMLGPGFFSSACWGVGAQETGFGLVFMGLALVVSITPGMTILNRWARIALAGLAFGMNVTEGADVGVMFCILGALFVVYLAVIGHFGPLASVDRRIALAVGNLGLALLLIVGARMEIGMLKLCALLVIAVAWNWAMFSRFSLANRVADGVMKSGVIAFFALCIASYSVLTLVGSQIKGVAGMQQDPETRAHRWSEATHWSLPKRETLSFIVPELFGCKMDTPKDMEIFENWFEGGSYWGAIGRDPVWDDYFGKPLRAGDSLRVTYPEAPNLNMVQTIKPDGALSLPQVGDVPAAGLTRFQLQKKLTAVYAEVSGPRGVVEAPGGSLNFSGGTLYVGVLVTLLALWAAAQSLRGPRSVFTPTERKLVWFWAVAALLSLLFAYGRFAPFYQFVYALPYFSTIRNPTKFLAIFTWATMILFGYGVHGLLRRYADVPAASAPFAARLKSWWAKAERFDRAWILGCAAAIFVGIVGSAVYSGSRAGLEEYLTELHRVGGYSADQARDVARGEAGFSIGQLKVFNVWLIASVAGMFLTLAGVFAGRRAKWAAIVLGTLLVVDLVRADLPFLVYWDYPKKYDLAPDNHAQTTNPVINFLRDKSYEHRVAILPFQMPPVLQQLYRIEWAQHHFQYFNVQSLDIVQMPRMQENLLAFEGALQPRSQDSLYLFARRWELTNTRYLLGLAGSVDELNRELGDPHHQFRVALPFNITLKKDVPNFRALEDITAVIDPGTNAPFAVLEFTGALPRAKLYSDWHVSSTNDPAVQEWVKTLREHSARETSDALEHQTAADQATLYELTRKSFAPERTVLLSGPLPAALPPRASGTNDNPGTAEYVSYEPRHIVFKTKAPEATVLLLNDKYDADWHILVDGRPSDLLRCNFIMRGVYLPPGEHTVDFQYRPQYKALFVSLAAIGLGLLLLGYLAMSNRPSKDSAPAPGPRTPEHRNPAEPASKSSKKRSN